MPTPQSTNGKYSRASRGTRWWVIPGSLATALLLTLIPYPDWFRFAEPHWVSLVLFYWCLAVPERVGVGVGWAMGLLMDLMLHTLFGMHAMRLAFIALIGVTFHRKIRIYPLWQQCLVILALSTLEILFVGWIFKMTHHAEFRLIYWQAALSSTLVWPVIYSILRFARRHSGIVRVK